jgi:hypothetical protein
VFSWISFVIMALFLLATLGFVLVILHTGVGGSN